MALAFIFLLYIAATVTFPGAYSSAISKLLEKQDSKRAPPQVQVAAARCVLGRLLPSHSSSFHFQIVSKEQRGGASCFIIKNNPPFFKPGIDPEILCVTNS